MSATPGVNKFSFTKLALRVIKLLISLAYCAADFVWIHLCRLMRKNKPGACVILYYHSVPGPYREKFSEQMRLVKASGKIVDLRCFGQLPENSRSIAVTFDDALETFSVNAVPVLQQMEIPTTVFAVSDAMGAKPGWGDSYYSPDERVMSSQQLCSLPELIAVGSHTLTHANLALLSPEAAAKEIVQSRERLETLLQRPVKLFSFPFGAFNSFTVRQCREAGYERVFTTEPTFAFSHEFVNGRVAVDPWDWKWEFRLKILGAYRWHTAARNLLNSVQKLFAKEDTDSSALPIQQSNTRKVSG
jgi:peptidoglycan/xylan/chitin deacetylase (PgdA/CDA1 family)